MLQPTHCIEQWEDRAGKTFISNVKPINEFNKSLAMSKRYKKKYGFKTIVLFKIAYKPGCEPKIITEHG